MAEQLQGSLTVVVLPHGLQEFGGQGPALVGVRLGEEDASDGSPEELEYSSWRRCRPRNVCSGTFVRWLADGITSHLPVLSVRPRSRAFNSKWRMKLCTAAAEPAMVPPSR